MMPTLLEREALPVTYQGLKRLEQSMLNGIAEGTLREVETPLQHEFIDGVYIRKAFYPKGTTIVGKIHNTKHAFAVITGCIAIVSEDGGRQILYPGDLGVAGPGIKRAAHALEDTICFNVHTNKDNDTDLAVLESKLIRPEAIGYDSKKELT